MTVCTAATWARDRHRKSLRDDVAFQRQMRRLQLVLVVLGQRRLLLDQAPAATEQVGREAGIGPGRVGRESRDDEAGRAD
jgi:hypothetical protein